jgi:hypothetical protein
MLFAVASSRRAMACFPMTHQNVASVPESSEESEALRLLLVALAAALLFHGGLLPFTHGNTYDAFIHMFFGDHYNRNWFDPWEPRWYTGFATTSYPPGTHMAIGALAHLMPLRAAFVVVQLTSILLLIVGVFRFSLLWVPPRSAGYAALAAVLASSISETVHLFGQLPTICSLGIFLNGLPYVYRWIVIGGWRNCAAATAFAAATTAAHHVTTIFGGVLFVLPLGLHALRAVAEHDGRVGLTRLSRVVRFAVPLGRAGLLAGLMLVAIVLTVFPYWHWSISDPITQVPIPHGTRESFIERPDLGLVFFVIPWGVSILFLPYAVYKTATSRLWPLGLCLLLCVVLGTGGTTPIPRAILRGAFDILTLDRFTFWATILILPFVGLMFDGLLHGRSGRILTAALGRGAYRFFIVGSFAAMTLLAVFPALLPRIKPMQPEFVDPTPIVRFMAEDEHDRWRYLTLGFGDQFAYLSARTEALSVDGNYHSARRLPDLTQFSVERLENAKYMGVPGLGSLQQFLVNAEKYNLKYVFSNDQFYDPLLHFTGWTRLNRLGNGIVVWERPDIPPLPLFVARRNFSPVHAVMWGVLPPTALLVAGAIFLMSALRRGFGAHMSEYRPVSRREDSFGNPRNVRLVVYGLAGLTMVAGTLALWHLHSRITTPETAEEVIAGYFEDLDFRRYKSAFARLDPETRGAFDDVYFGWRWTGGLIASFGKLDGLAIEQLQTTGLVVDWAVRLDWLTALDIRSEERSIRTVKRDGRWYLAPTALRPVQTPVRLQREKVIDWNVVGRRQPRPETDLHRDRLDRPRVAIPAATLVRHNGRYSVVGQITNSDADPAAITILSNLNGRNGALMTQAAGTVNGDRLLPAESAGFRVSFQGVLSLEQAFVTGEYDPTLFVPPELEVPPVDATVTARALVASSGLYRGVSLNAVRTLVEEGSLRISGLAVNTGTETATIIRINVLLYDHSGAPLWADVGYVETNVYPGQSASFAISLPLGGDIEPIAAIGPADIAVNGSGMQTDLGIPGARDGTLPMPEGSGYASARLFVSSMTHDTLF